MRGARRGPLEPRAPGERLMRVSDPAGATGMTGMIGVICATIDRAGRGRSRYFRAGGFSRCSSVLRRSSMSRTTGGVDGLPAPAASAAAAPGGLGTPGPEAGPPPLAGAAAPGTVDGDAVSTGLPGDPPAASAPAEAGGLEGPAASNDPLARGEEPAGPAPATNGVASEGGSGGTAPGTGKMIHSTPSTPIATSRKNRRNISRVRRSGEPPTTGAASRCCRPARPPPAAIRPSAGTRGVCRGCG